MRRASPAGLAVHRQLALPTALGEPRELLSVLFSSCAVGVAICDRQFRFRAINDALAAMNGMPAQAHLGKTIHAILGKASEKVLPAFKHVFSTGRPVVNFELIAVLPQRKHPGHWVANYLPIRNRVGHVQEIGAVVIELSKQSVIEARLVRLLDELLRASVMLRHTRTQSTENRATGEGPTQRDPLASSHALIEKCIAEALAISRVLSFSTPFTSRPVVSSAGSATPLTQTSASFDCQPASSISPRDQRHQKSLLTQREREVLAQLANGKTNKQLANEMSISIRTVETYRGRIMLKLGLHSVTELVRYAIRNGIA